jgi:dTDP-4-dehydrorhamnose 3,5-epimerase
VEKIETSIDGLYLLKFSSKYDDRGYFLRNHCEQEFYNMGLKTHFRQSSLSFSKKTGTLRGMHLQKAPHEEVKLIQCLSGKIYDVIVDVRPNSKTFKKWQAFELSAHDSQALYVPAGCAHGFITLANDVLIQYRMDVTYNSEAQVGFRWNDPTFSIEWPVDPTIISDRDENYKNYESKIF